MNYPTTPDGRYFVVKGRLWRCTNPALDDKAKKHWVSQLMNARRAVKQAKQTHDSAALATARQQVNQAKVALGERGPIWWKDGAPDYSRYLAKNTPYASWHAQVTSDEQTQ